MLRQSLCPYQAMSGQRISNKRHMQCRFLWLLKLNIDFFYIFTLQKHKRPAMHMPPTVRLSKNQQHFVNNFATSFLFKNRLSLSLVYEIY